MLLSATSLQRLPAGAAVFEFGASDEASTLLASTARNDDRVPLLALIQAPPPRPAAPCGRRCRGDAGGVRTRARGAGCGRKPARAHVRQPGSFQATCRMDNRFVDQLFNQFVNQSINLHDVGCVRSGVGAACPATGPAAAIAR